jgi:hypothetical protein
MRINAAAISPIHNGRGIRIEKRRGSEGVGLAEAEDMPSVYRGQMGQ